MLSRNSFHLFIYLLLLYRNSKRLETGQMSLNRDSWISHTMEDSETAKVTREMLAYCWVGCFETKAKWVSSIGNCLLVYYNIMWLRNIQIEECIGPEFSCSVGVPLSPNFHVFTNLEAPTILNNFWTRGHTISFCTELHDYTDGYVCRRGSVSYILLLCKVEVLKNIKLRNFITVKRNRDLFPCWDLDTFIQKINNLSKPAMYV